jgi:cytosine deaminase
MGETLARSSVAIMTHGPGKRAMPPVAALLAAGVTVFAGSDNIRDAWSPFGSPCMLERAMWIAYRGDFRRDEEIEAMLGLVTTGAARALGLADYGVREGCPADLVIVDAECPAEAVASRPQPKLVMKGGKLLLNELGPAAGSSRSGQLSS